MSTDCAAKVTRFYLLDIARFVAAFAVVLWHFQYFYFVGFGVPDDFHRYVQPLYPFLWFFYEHGGNAVRFFFVLSGFIFFWGYREGVAQRKISAIKFAWLRFSRLYPLHLVTLLAVGLLQIVSMSFLGRELLEHSNDWHHFFGHLTLLSQWGIFDPTFSFNAPSWSLSLELFAYVVFFIIARLKLGGGLLSASVLWAGAFGLSYLCRPFGIVLKHFLGGGLAYLLYLQIVSIKDARWEKYLIRPALVFGIGASLYPVIFMLPRTYSMDIWVVLSGCVILLLALLQNARPIRGKGLAWLGDMTYSSYMIHYPLILLIVLSANLMGLEIVPGLGLFIGFGLVLWPLAWATYHYFEKPAQDTLRQWFKRQKWVS